MYQHCEFEGRHEFEGLILEGRWGARLSCCFTRWWGASSFQLRRRRSADRAVLIVLVVLVFMRVYSAGYLRRTLTEQRATHVLFLLLLLVPTW